MPLGASSLFVASGRGKICDMSDLRHILKLSENDEEKELEFELQYLRSLTTEERFEMMWKKSREMLKQMVDLGYRKPFEIVKRS
jgi:hypothetical protein